MSLLAGAASPLPTAPRSGFAPSAQAQKNSGSAYCYREGICPQGHQKHLGLHKHPLRDFPQMLAHHLYKLSVHYRIFSGKHYMHPHQMPEMPSILTECCKKVGVEEGPKSNMQGICSHVSEENEVSQSCQQACTVLIAQSTITEATPEHFLRPTLHSTQRPQNFLHRFRNNFTKNIASPVPACAAVYPAAAGPGWQWHSGLTRAALPPPPKPHRPPAPALKPPSAPLQPH